MFSNIEIVYILFVDHFLSSYFKFPFLMLVEISGGFRDCGAQGQKHAGPLF